MHPEGNILVEIVLADVPHALEAAFARRATASFVGILEPDVQRSVSMRSQNQETPRVHFQLAAKGKL